MGAPALDLHVDGGCRTAGAAHTSETRGRQLTRTTSIRAKVLLFAIALGTVPGAAIGLVAFRMASRALEKAAGEQLVVLAQDVADTLGSEMDEERRNVAAWARQEVMRDLIVGDIDKRITKFLSSIIGSYPGYAGLFVSDLEGTIVAATAGERVGRRVTIRTTDTAGTRPLRLPEHEGLVLEWAEAIADPDAPGVRIGTFVAHFEWAGVSAVMERVRRGITASGLDVGLLVVDGDDRVLGGAWRSAIDRALGSTMRELRWDGIAHLLDDSAGAFTLEPVLDAVVGAVSAPGLGPGWRVLAFQPRGQALAPAYELRRRVVLVLLAVLAVALALGTWLAERLGRPLRELTAATRQLATTGELDHPIPVGSSDEIGELAAAFNAAATDLQRARDDLVIASKLAFVGELAAGMAHEIRTPLGILRSSAQMLGRQGGSSVERREELVAMIIDEVDRLDRVVTGLTDLARPHELQIRTTHLDEVLGRVLDFVAGQAVERGIVVARDFPPAVAPAWCDPDEIHQVALNLVMNAIQMMGAGGRLTVRILPQRAGLVGFEVEDTGPGLSPDRQRRVFTPFVSFRKGGTGLGLALAQRIVVSHGGTISVRSIEGHGAVFRVELPVAREAA